VLRAARAPVPALLRGDWTPRSGYEVGQSLLEIPELTAVLVANDQMALGLLRRLHEAGREVPRDLSLVGFDDIPEAPTSPPPDHGPAGLRRARAALPARAAGAHRGERGPTRVVVAPELVVRASTGAAPRSRSAVPHSRRAQ
jgi:DNA-binding LacI/PurR family transcriptional regulator